MVAEWVHEIAVRHLTARATVDLVDLAEYELPLLDEPVPAAFGEYRHEHTRRWAAAVGSYDGFVFVTPEYNHAVPAALKNAIDFLFDEWQDKAAGFVSHGVHGGVRAVEQLRLTMGELRVADVRAQVALSAFTDFEISDPTQPGRVTAAAHQEQTLAEMLDEVASWSRALRPLRARPGLVGA
jgi:NAD(P)H-dependent FMN reductase